MNTNDEFVITRIFNAPRKLVWNTWTKPEHLKHWWGPEGFKIRVSSFDLKPGGIFHYCMYGTDVPEMWGKFVFREINAPKLLIYVNSFSDEHGNTTMPPFDQNWPKEILNTVSLTELNDKTKLTLNSWPVNATDEERKTFKDNYDSMSKGFGGTFAKLEEHLAGIQ